MIANANNSFRLREHPIESSGAKCKISQRDLIIRSLYLERRHGNSDCNHDAALPFEPRFQEDKAALQSRTPYTGIRGNLDLRRGH